MTTINPILLKSNPLFKPLQQEQLNQVLETTRCYTLREGQQLFHYGQPAEYFYLVVRGQIKLFLVSEEGHEKIIDLIGSKRTFAEAVMFMEQQCYPVNATALCDSEVYSIRNQVYRQLLSESTELCLSLCAGLSKRLHSLLSEIDRLTLQNATYRVVGYIHDLVPDSTDNSAVIDLAAPKRIIASRLSITPETLSRILRMMTEEKIITMRGKTVAIQDLRRLQEFGRQAPSTYAPIHRQA